LWQKTGSSRTLAQTTPVEGTHLESFYSHQSTHEIEFSADFINLIAAIKKYRWIDQYPYEYGLDKACKGLSSRISFSNNLGNGIQYFKMFEELIEQSFQSFMLDANKKFNVQY